MKWWEYKFQKELKMFGWPTSGNEEERKKTYNSLKSIFKHRYSELHKYNDIAGHVELWIQNKEILLKYYLNGDKRKKYNKEKSIRRNKRIIYELFNYNKGSYIKGMDNTSIRNGISECLDRIENQCSQWNLYINIDEIKEKMEFIDYQSFIAHKITHTNLPSKN